MMCLYSDASSTEDSSDSGLSGGAIAGIVIGVLVGVGVIVFGGWYYWENYYKVKGENEDDLIKDIEIQAGSPNSLDAIELPSEEFPAERNESVVP